MAKKQPQKHSRRQSEPTKGRANPGQRSQQRSRQPRPKTSAAHEAALIDLVEKQ